MAGQARQVVIPFVGAAHAYRRKYYTNSPTAAMTTSTADVSPSANKIFAYGFLRASAVKVTTNTAASSGGTYATGGVYNLVNNVVVRQPGGQEMFGGPNMTGWLNYLANKQSAWKAVNDPTLYPSFSSSVTNPSFVLRQIFEINAQSGLGALPNQNDAAPWQLTFVQNSTTNAYTTAPTTTNPTLKYDYFIECWTVPSPVNPLRPNVRQITAPPLLGTLNKWTTQQYQVPGGSQFDVPLVRKGNSLRNLLTVTYNASNVPIALTNFPNPITLQWDGTVIRVNDDPNLWIDDEYMTRLGAAAVTPETQDTGVLPLKFSDPGGIDVSALGLDGLGMVKQWGTTQTSTITLGGTWGGSVSYVVFVTNDVQYVLPSPNPYALASGEPFLSNMAQPSAVS
jgi:hypothetical protein